MALAEMEIPSEPSQLAGIRSFVTAFCRGAPVPLLDEDSIGQLEMAVNEAATNIMRHAHHGRSDLRIQVEADINEESVSIRLSYSGDYFDPASAPAPAFDGSREGGFGVYIISKFVDEVRYSQEPDGTNRLCLLKARSLPLFTEAITNMR